MKIKCNLSHSKLFLRPGRFPCGRFPCGRFPCGRAVTDDTTINITINGIKPLIYRENNFK